MVETPAPKPKVEPEVNGGIEHVECVNTEEAMEKERAKYEPVLKIGNFRKVFMYRMAKAIFVDLCSIGGIAAIAYSGFNCMMIMPLQVHIPLLDINIGFTARPSDSLCQNSQWINLLLWFNVVNKKATNKVLDGFSELLKNWNVKK